MVAALILEDREEGGQKDGHNKWNTAHFETMWKQLKRTEGREMDLCGSA
jgi:hypothetical protein